MPGGLGSLEEFLKHDPGYSLAFITNHAPYLTSTATSTSYSISLIMRLTSLTPHLGAFSDYSNAAKIKARASLVTKEPIQIFSSNNFGIKIYKVRVGPLRGVGESDSLLQRLSYAGYRRPFSIVK